MSFLGETWGYLPKATANEYCTFQGKRLITKVEFDLLFNAYSDRRKSFTETLGWPARDTNNPDTVVYYHVQDSADVVSGQAVDGLTGELAASDNAIPLCVFEPVEPVVPTPTPTP